MQILKSENAFSVALIGRPNVGKSSLFNVLCKKRLALVKDQPGVTRDLRWGYAKWWGHEFNVCDTGGWTRSEDIISQAIRDKLKSQLEKMDLLLFVCDAREGITSDDRNFFSVIRELGKDYIIVLNKCDSDKHDTNDFYTLGVDQFFEISCEHKIGIDHLLEEIFCRQNVELTTEKNSEDSFEAGSVDTDLEQEDFEIAEATADDEERPLSITVIGKPNVGKSSLINRILKKEQQLVSSLAGTTTDTLSFDGRYGGLDFKIFDTAGVRRKAKLDGGLEGLTVIKSLETIDKADFVLLVFDGTDQPSRAEAQLIQRCVEKAKPFLIVVNKWDIAKEKEDRNKDTYKKALVSEYHFLKDFEFVFVSALTGSNIDRLFDKMEMMREKLAKRIGTGELNRFFERVVKMAPSPFYHNKPVRLYYITQTKQKTPSFLCFANHPKGVTPSYRRFLENRIKEEFDFSGVPVRVFFLPKDSSKRGHHFNG